MNPFRRHVHEWYRSDEWTWRCYDCGAVTHAAPWDGREFAARELEADAMGVRAGLIAPDDRDFALGFVDPRGVTPIEDSFRYRVTERLDAAIQALRDAEGIARIEREEPLADRIRSIYKQIDLPLLVRRRGKDAMNSPVWHFYPDAQELVPVGAHALCGHVADVETSERIEPQDFRCVECVYLLDVQDAER